MYPKVLLVDDDPTVHQAVRLRLQRGASVVGCLGALEAVAAVGTERFDVALIDVNLGQGLSGPQLIPLLREVDAELTPVIFTAFTDYATTVRSLEAHSFDFIAKSLGDDDLFMDKIGHAAARTREQRERAAGLRAVAALRAALDDARVGREIGISAVEIQQGLLGDSLDAFSALVGRVELVELELRKLGARPEFSGLVGISGRAVADLNECVAKLRKYFTETERPTRSANAVLARVARALNEDAVQFGAGPVEAPALTPDPLLGRDSRLLFRAVLILSRLLRAMSPKDPTFFLAARWIPQPALAMAMLANSSRARVFCGRNFGKELPEAVTVEIGIGRVRMGGGQARLFDVGEGAGWGSLDVATALVAQLDGALVAEATEGAGVVFRIIFV